MNSKLKFYSILLLSITAVILIIYSIIYKPECESCKKISKPVLKENFKFKYDLNYCDVNMKECMNDKNNTLEDCYNIVGDECRNSYPN